MEKWRLWKVKQSMLFPFSHRFNTNSHSSRFYCYGSFLFNDISVRLYIHHYKSGWLIIILKDMTTCAFREPSCEINGQLINSIQSIHLHEITIKMHCRVKLQKENSCPIKLKGIWHASNWVGKIKRK